MTPQWVDLLGAGSAALEEHFARYREGGRCRRSGLDDLTTVHSEKRRIGFHILLPLRRGSGLDEWSTGCEGQFDANQGGIEGGHVRDESQAALRIPVNRGRYSPKNRTRLLIHDFTPQSRRLVLRLAADLIQAEEIRDMRTQPA
jgi:hypothetical protein